MGSYYANNLLAIMKLEYIISARKKKNAKKIMDKTAFYKQKNASFLE